MLYWISTAYSKLYLWNLYTGFWKWTEIQRFHCGSQTTLSHSMLHLKSFQGSYSVLKHSQLDFPCIADRHKPLPSNMCVWLDWGCQGSTYLWWVVDTDTGPSEWTGTVSYSIRNNCVVTYQKRCDCPSTAVWLWKVWAGCCHKYKNPRWHKKWSYPLKLKSSNTRQAMCILHNIWGTFV